MVAGESTENELPGGTPVLGRYSVVGKLAQGGMAEVYLARQIGPAGYQKLVVIKRVRPHLANDEDFVGMFVNEARLAAMINHPNVVQIFDLGDQPRPDSQGGGQDWFLAMEYLDGRDMLQVGRACRAHNKAVPFDVTARIIADACAGLEHAHGLKGNDGKSLGLVHRDMSPENVLITFEGQVKVVDFGIAKASDNLIKTQAGQIKGKLGYVAPEAILGKPVDARADVFAIGATLYLFLSGRPAFTGSNPMEIFERSLKPPTPPREVNPRVPEALDAICMKALAQDREKRYRSAGEVRVALEDYLQSTGRPLGAAQLSQFMRILFPPDKDPVRQRIDKLLADAPVVEVKRTATQPAMPAPLSQQPLPVTMSSSPAPVEPQPVYYDDERTNVVDSAMLLDDVPDPVTLQGQQRPPSRGPAHLRSVGVADISSLSGQRPIPLPPSSSSSSSSTAPASRSQKASPGLTDMTFEDLQLRTTPGGAVGADAAAVLQAKGPPTIPVRQPPQTAPSRAALATVEVDDDMDMDIDIAAALAESDEADALVTVNVPGPMTATKTGIMKGPDNSVDSVAAALGYGFSVDDDDVGPPPPLESSIPTKRPQIRTELDGPPPPTWPAPSPSPPPPPPPPAEPAWPPPAPPAEPAWSPPPQAAQPAFERADESPFVAVDLAMTPASSVPSFGLRLAMLGFGIVSGLIVLIVVLAATGQLARII